MRDMPLVWWLLAAAAVVFVLSFILMDHSAALGRCQETHSLATCVHTLR